MNKVILMGRLTRDPEVRRSAGDASGASVVRYTIAVDRRFSRAGSGESNADFVPCVVFGRGAEFAEKYLRQGTKIAITGRIQTGSYTNREGRKVYTTEIVVDEQEFAESKAAAAGNGYGQAQGYQGGQNYAPQGGYQAPASSFPTSSFEDNGFGGGYGQSRTAQAPAPIGGNSQPLDDGFMNIPDGLEEELPFI